MKKVYFLVILNILIFISSCQTYQHKKEYIGNNLETTNNHVINGSWYSTAHGEFIIPEILKDKNEILKNL